MVSFFAPLFRFRPGLDNAVRAVYNLPYNQWILQSHLLYIRQNMDIKNFKKSGINEKIAAFLCGILLLITILITSTQALCYWIPDWWRNEYAKYDTPQYVTGEMSLDDAVYITEQMLDYCIGRLDTLDDTEATIDGVTAPFFTDREKSHLADCRNIFLGAVRFRVISILLIIAFVIALYYSASGRLSAENRSNEKDPEAVYRPDRSLIFSHMSRTLARGYLVALAALLLFACILVLIGMHDFTYLFTKFHHVFFDNDLWILDPGCDNLVNVMQESVFEDAAITIGSIWAAIAAALAVISAVILKRSQK